MSLSRKSIDRLLYLATIGFEHIGPDGVNRDTDERLLDRSRAALLPAERKPASGRGRRAKGQKGEREAAKFLAEQGFPEAARGLGQARGGGKEVADCINVGPLHIEVKRVEKLNVVDAVKQAERDASEEKIPLVLHRRNNHPWLVTMPADKFFEIFRESDVCHMPRSLVYNPTLDVDKEKENA